MPSSLCLSGTGRRQWPTGEHSDFAKYSRKHEATDNVLANMADILENGKVTVDPKFSNKRWVSWNGYRVIVSIDRFGEEAPWLITCFKVSTPQAKKNPSTGTTSIGSRDPQVQKDRPRISTDSEIILRKIFIVK